ncbi:MAG: oligosaccharide flippase family protein [Chloroflexi bacterium]|nr:oligosaccharide flippase family protein [Chloroflexota bacterium]
MFVLLSSYLNLAVGFVVTILLTRQLSPEAFGIVSLGTFFLGLLDVRSKFGFEHAFTQRQPTTPEAIDTYLGLQLGFGLATVLVALVAWLPLGWLGYAVEVREALLILAALALVDAAGAVPRVALEKELNFRATSVVVSVALLVSNVVAVIMAFTGFGYWSLLAQVGVNAFVGAVGYWRVAGLRARPRVNRDIAVWMLRFGGVMAVGSVATLILLQYDNFLVGTFAGVATLGFYERAYKVAQWPTGLVTHVVSRSAFPTYAKLQDDRPRLSKAFNLTLWLITTLSLPVAIALFVSAPDFIELIFGGAWLPSALFLRVLIGYSLLRPLLDDTGALFTALGKPHLSSLTVGAQAVALILFATPLTLIYGAVGTAIGVGIAFVVGVIVAYRNVARQVDLAFGDTFLRPALAAAAALAVYALVRLGGDFNVLPVPARFVLKAGLASITYVSVALLLDRRTLIDRTRYIVSFLRATPNSEGNP